MEAILWHMYACFVFSFPAANKTESVDARQRSYDLGIQIGYQRRNKDVLAWVKKRRRTIRREDLISFLCGKAPPPRTSRAAPKLTVMSPNRASSTDTVSSVEADLQPFREAIALHGKYHQLPLNDFGVCFCVSVCVCGRSVCLFMFMTCKCM